MEQGTVKWFNENKGFGFIQTDRGDDLFVHHSSIDMDGFRTLVEGSRVVFTIENSEKGPRAGSVRNA